MPPKPDWPDSLKKFVERTFAKATEANKDKVAKELKDLIHKAYAADALNTTDWTKVEIQALKPPTGKRKANSAFPSSSSSILSMPVADEADARTKRARRFERELEIERRRERGEDVSMGAPQMSLSRFVNAPDDPALVNRMGGLSTGRKKKWANSKMPGLEDEGEKTFDPNVIDWDQYTIVGTSQQLEKRYLRLTSAPDPSTIRPLPVLKQTLDLLKRKWRQENDYSYICDQMKSLRQDLTVQRIKNDFTVSVYEIHARIALENGDMGEYNQCAATLQHLYAHNLAGHPLEFLAYKILYLLYSRNWSAVNVLLGELTPEQKAADAVRHALNVRSAMATSNYHAFFRLFLSAPNMGGYIMDMFIERERLKALIFMSKSYIHLPLKYIASELAFDDVHEAARFIEALKANHWVLPKSSSTPAPPPPVKARRFTAGPPPPPPPPDEEKVLDCKAAGLTLAAATSRYVRVDIKGQLS